MNTLSVVFFFGLVTYACCQMVGGPSEVGPNDAAIKRMAEFAVGEIGSEYELVRVVSGKKQLVNGMLYTIQLVAKRKIVGEKNKRRRCNVLVYEIMHEGYMELEEFHCHFNDKQPLL